MIDLLCIKEFHLKNGHPKRKVIFLTNMFLLIFLIVGGCVNNESKMKRSNSLKEALIEFQNECKRVGIQGNINVKDLTEGDSIALEHINDEIYRLKHSDTIFKSFLTKLSVPEIKDTSSRPKNEIIRLLYLGLDNFDDPKVFSFCCTIDLLSSSCIKKKFKIDIDGENLKKYKLKEMPIKIYSIDTIIINGNQIREIKNLLDYNDYWLLNKQGSLGDCSSNSWYIETLLNNDYGLPTYKRLQGQVVGQFLLFWKSNGINPGQLLP